MGTDCESMIELNELLMELAYNCCMKVSSPADCDGSGEFAWEERWVYFE